MMTDETKIGKEELRVWIEDTLKRKDFSFSCLKDGDIYLELFEYIWPQVMKKYKGSIIMYPSSDNERKENWKMIKNVLKSVHLEEDFIKYNDIIENNFKGCYESLIILYFLYSLVRYHECDFILAHPIDQKLTDFMSSEKPLTCLIRTGSVHLPNNVFEKVRSMPEYEDIHIIDDENEKNDDRYDVMYDQCNTIFNTSDKKLNTQNNFSFKKDNSTEHLNLMYPINSHMEENTFDKYIKNYETHTNVHNKEEEQNMIGYNNSNSNTNLKQEFKEYNNKMFLEMNNENNEQLDDRVNRNYTNKEEKYQTYDKRYDKRYDKKYDKRYDKNDNFIGYKKGQDDDTISYNKHFSDNILSDVTLNRFTSNISCYDDNMDIKTKNSNEFHINGIKRKSVSHNISNVSTSPCSDFFKYFRFEEGIFHDNKRDDNVFMINNNEDILEHDSGLHKNEKYNIHTNKHNNNKNNNNNNNNNNSNKSNTCFATSPVNFFKPFNKDKVDVSSQTDYNHEDIFLNNIIHHENMKNLEVIWNNDEQKLKGESFLLFLKNQIKMYKKELIIKNDEIKSMKNIHKKNIDDIISSHILEISKLKEKHQADIFFLKNQHLENIVSVRKNFESKLNHIEEDLLLDLDILYKENNGNTLNEQINEIIISEHNEREKYGLDKHIDNFLNDNKMNKWDMTNNMDNSTDHINNNNNNNDNSNDHYNNNTLKYSDRTNNIRDDNNIEIKHNNNLMIYEKDTINEHISINDILYNNNSNKIIRNNKDIFLKNGEHNLKNNVMIPHELDNPLKKLKFMLNQKNKEHEENNKYIKEEMTHLKQIYNQVFLEKNKEYNEIYVNNKIFYDILEYIKKDNNCVGDDIFNKNNEHYSIEKIKKNIYDIIIKNNKESKIYLKEKKKEEKDIVKELDENWLINLLIYMNSLLQLERIRLEDMKIKEERDICIYNYMKNKNMKKKDNYLFLLNNDMNKKELINDTNDISSNELHRLENEMDTNEKIKMLKERNRKLLSLNEFYKKKLEHIQIWKTKLEIMKTNKYNQFVVNENKENIFLKKYKCDDDKGVTTNDMEYTHNNNNNNNNIYNNNIYNYSNNLKGFTSMWLPLIYLKPVEEENKRDAELMYLLKMLDRYDNENKKNGIWSSNNEENDNNMVDEKIMNDIYHNNNNINSNSIFNFAYNFDDEYISCLKTDNRKCTDKDYNDRENEFVYAPYNLLNVLKKKLTYIFWQLLGDIYKYRNVIIETCNYIYNIHNLFNEHINKYEKDEKKKEESYNKCMKDKEDDYLNEKYNLRELIGITKLKLEICTNEYIELKENYEKEKKRLIILTNRCYENESMKYKSTIQQFKNVDKQLKIYKAREKKWINLIELLILELKNSSKQNQEDIKNVWLEIISTKKEAINNDNTICMENNNSDDYLIIDKGDQEKCNHLINEKNVVIDSINKDIDENNLGFEYNHDKHNMDINNNNNNNIIKNLDDLIRKNKTEQEDNRKKKLPMKKEENDKINIYKKDFHGFLDDIIKSEVFQFYSFEESNNFISNKINAHINNNTSFNINTNEYYGNSNEMYIFKENMEDYNIYYNKKINHVYNNYIVNNYNNDDIKDGPNNNDNNNNNNDTHIHTHNTNKHSLNKIKDKFYEGKDFFNLLSAMAKESCLIFQILLKIKEDDIKEKTEKITSLEKKLYLLKQYNINEKNKNKLLLEKQEILIHKIKTLNIDIHKLQTYISSINKEKIYLKTHNLTKEQELNLIITYYKNIIISIKKHLNKYSTVLYLLDNIPQHDKDIILNLTNITHEKYNNFKFSFDKQQKDQLTKKKKNEFNDETSDYSLQQANLQLLKDKALNENIITVDDNNEHLSDISLEDIIKNTQYN
ncbi:calponin homology domain-containing protein, putative [Plasmodium sp. gorilla clade G2]|uniref:calponin homology domain-containing protein, putative n=1 Tax=Plasmodium sp. gorilla clade G2 TaxID=880535 RepID=UPI000D1FEC0E|nr:calponin homology domain-containing protein, putative [Plasmodium sp. gorilla clade G2]SOV19447.1 calponin homology domain-containing protein, putative [Plasmodium sp. gorilla clade G2]